MKMKMDETAQQKHYRELVLMVDVFAASIEAGLLPKHGSPCHRMARKLVDESGIRPQRRRRRLPKIEKRGGQS